MRRSETPSRGKSQCPTCFEMEVKNSCRQTDGGIWAWHISSISSSTSSIMETNQKFRSVAPYTLNGPLGPNMHSNQPLKVLTNDTEPRPARTPICEMKGRSLGGELGRAAVDQEDLRVGALLSTSRPGSSNHPTEQQPGLALATKMSMIRK